MMVSLLFTGEKCRNNNSISWEKKSLGCTEVRASFIYFCDSTRFRETFFPPSLLYLIPSLSRSLVCVCILFLSVGGFLRLSRARIKHFIVCSLDSLPFHCYHLHHHHYFYYHSLRGNNNIDNCEILNFFWPI